MLIADPSAAVMDRLADSIHDVAQVVGRATNARDAISVVRAANPQLTIFDISVANGVELLRVLKSHQPPVVAVVLTHSAEDTTRRYCLRLGAEYFLDKIQDFQKVREIVKALNGNAGLDVSN